MWIFAGCSCSTVIVHWTRRSIGQVILHLGHNSYRKVISLAQVVPGPVYLYRVESWPHHSFHLWIFTDHGWASCCQVNDWDCQGTGWGGGRRHHISHHTGYVHKEFTNYQLFTYQNPCSTMYSSIINSSYYTWMGEGGEMGEGWTCPDCLY